MFLKFNFTWKYTWSEILRTVKEFILRLNGQSNYFILFLCVCNMGWTLESLGFEWVHTWFEPNIGGLLASSTSWLNQISVQYEIKEFPSVLCLTPMIRVSMQLGWVLGGYDFLGFLTELFMQDPDSFSYKCLLEKSTFCILIVILVICDSRVTLDVGLDLEYALSFSSSPLPFESINAF